MTWNYRIIQKTGYGETSFGIHEVYYNSDGTVCSMTENPVRAYGETTGELAEDLQRMLDAIQKPVLVYESIVWGETK